MLPIDNESDVNLLKIKSPNLLHQFHETNFHQTPLGYYITLLIVFLVILYVQCNNFIKGIHESNSLLWLRCLVTISALISNISICFLLYVKLFYKKENYSYWIHYTRYGLIFTSAMSQNLRYIELNIIGKSCSDTVGFTQIFCDHFDYNTASLIMILSPLFLTSLLRIYDIRVNLIYFILSIIILLIGSAINEHYPSLVVISFFGICGFFFMYDLQIQSVSMFLLNHKLQDTLDENEKNADRIHADEMRHMIANVAHDLKTPLTSFMTGMELITMVVSESQQRIESNLLDRQNQSETNFSILQCMENVRNTNTFMLMTINRCIDYTKASKGLKLVPRYETINLLETLSLPLNCMKNIQHRIEIHLNPLPKDICSHIITDLQWLQENILCLLSNAVKYSTEGNVSITVSVIDDKPEKTIMKSATSVLSLFKMSSKHQKIIPTDRETSISIHLQDPSTKRLKYSEICDNSSSESKDITHSSNLLLFEVEDTGIGMSDEAMASLFNPFKQTQRLAGGTGLGLYSLAKRVEALNGKYGVRRRRDGQKGSLFWFSIPYKPDETFTSIFTDASHNSKNIFTSFTNMRDFLGTRSHSHESNHFESHAPPARTNSCDTVNENITRMIRSSISIPNLSHLAANHWNILLVDDSPTILKMTAMILQKHGHRVTKVENGEEAVKMVETRWSKAHTIYDLVLMDLQMPVMDGLEATRRIRALEQQSFEAGEARPTQIVIGFSANSDSETTDEALSAGISCFIPKPFKIEAFYSVANALLS